MNVAPACGGCVGWLRLVAAMLGVRPVRARFWIGFLSWREDPYGIGSIPCNTCKETDFRKSFFVTIDEIVSLGDLVEWRVLLLRASMNPRHKALCCRSVGVRLFSCAPSGASLAGSRTQGSASLHPGLRSGAASRLKGSQFLPATTRYPGGLPDLVRMNPPRQASKGSPRAPSRAP